MLLLSNLIKEVKKQKTLLNYLSSSMVSIPVSLITSFISLKNIDPVLMGTWSAVSIFQGYAAFFGFGVLNGMNRELPHALGRKDNKKAYDLAANGLGFVSILAILYFALGICFLVVFTDNFYYKISVVALVSKLIIGLFGVYLEGTFRSNVDFDKLSKATWVSTLVRLVTCPLIFLGFEGFLIYMVLFDLSKTFLLFYWRPIRVKIQVNLSILETMIKVGMPIFIATYLGSLIDTIPRLFILKEGGEIALGLFAPVIMLVGIFEQFSGAMMSYVYPKFMFRYGEGEAIGSIYKSNLKIIAVVSTSLLVLMIPMFFALNYFVILFPKYKDSEPYLRIAIFLAPLVTHNLTGVIFVVLKKYTPLYLLQGLKATLLVSTIYLIDKFIVCETLNTVIFSIIVTYICLLIFGILMGLKIISLTITSAPN